MQSKDQKGKKDKAQKGIVTKGKLRLRGSNYYEKE